MAFPQHDPLKITLLVAAFFIDVPVGRNEGYQSKLPRNVSSLLTTGPNAPN